MIYSMTGYAAAACAVKGGAVQIELKSVNSRYLDYHFRVCDELRIAEPALRELIGARLVRGKLECRVSFIATASAAQHALLAGLKPLQCLVIFDTGIEGPRLVATENAQMRQADAKALRIARPVELIAHFVGNMVVDIADEAQRDVVVFGVDPAGSREAAPLQRQSGLDVVGDFEAGKEPGQRTRLQIRADSDLRRHATVA